MNPQSTDRTALDSNQFIPRVLYQGKVSVVTSTSNPAFGAYYGQGTIDLENLRVDANSEYDIWVKPPSETKLYKLPVYTLQTANGNNDWVAKAWLSRGTSGESFTVIAFDVFQLTATGSLTNSFTFYYTIYSTKITDDTIL